MTENCLNTLDNVCIRAVVRIATLFRCQILALKERQVVLKFKSGCHIYVARQTHLAV